MHDLGAGLRVIDRRYDAGLRQTAHRHAETQITIVRRGELVEETGSGSYVITTAMLIVKPASLRHEDRFGPAGAATTCIEIDAEAERMLTGGRQSLGYHVSSGGDALAAVARFCHERARGGSADADGCVAEVIAALGECGPSPVPRGVARAAASMLTEAYRGNLSIADLARELAVHPVSLARAFRREYGCTISRHVRQLRVAAAARLLASNELTLAAIALETGFSDQSHFTRAFRSVIGVSPGAFRRLSAV